MNAEDRWQTSRTVIQRIFPSRYRIFLSVKNPDRKIGGTRLFVKGHVLKAWANGVRLQRQKKSFFIPVTVIKPWENEIMMWGWPSQAWIETREKPGNKKTCPVPSSSPIVNAGKALTAFLVDKGPDSGDMFSFYDPVSHTFRLPRWRWDTGICLEALARLALHTRDPLFADCADKIISRMLSIQLSQPQCRGGIPEVTDLHMARNTYLVLPEWVVPFNGAFIGAGMLASLDVIDPCKKNICEISVQQIYQLMISHGITRDGFLKGYFHVSDHCWKYHGQINDSAIFPRFAFLLASRGLAVDKGPVLKYSQALASFIRPEGFVGRARWLDSDQTYPKASPLFPEWKKNPEQIPAKIFARGQAWYLLGASGIWGLSKERIYSQNIKRVAEYLLSVQDSSGFWHHDLRQPKLGLDVKGTAVICWALLEARQAFVDAGGEITKLMACVNKAWEALKNNQHQYLSGPLPGALCDDNDEGAIIYFRNRPMYTAYGTAAFILTGLLLEKKI
jgi:hypothetical protein